MKKFKGIMKKLKRRRTQILISALIFFATVDIYVFYEILKWSRILSIFFVAFWGLGGQLGLVLGLLIGI